MGRALHLAPALLAIIVIASIIGVVFATSGVAGFGVTITETEVGNQTVPHSPPDFDSTERLIVPSPTVEADDGSPAADPGRSTSMSFNQLRASYDAGVFEGEVDGTSSSETQLTIVQEELAIVEAELDKTMDEEFATFEAFHQGDIGTAELFAEMGVLNERSQTLQFRLDHISQTVQRITSPLTQDQVRIVRGQVSQLNMEAQTLEGPVRADSGDIVRGTATADSTFHVHASRDGYVLSTIDSGLYTREITVVPNRDRDGGSGYTNDDTARDRAATLYPWTYQEAIATESTLRGGIYWTSLDHPHGSTTMFLDGGTELPFREIHEIDLITIPTVIELESGDAEIDLEVARTYSGGPALVIATEPDSDDPVSDVSVSVDNRSVSTTNVNGEAWFISPPTTFDLTIETDDWETTYELTFPVGEPTVG